MIRRLRRPTLRVVVRCASTLLRQLRWLGRTRQGPHPVSLINQKAQRSLGSLVYWRRDRDYSAPLAPHPSGRRRCASTFLRQLRWLGRTRQGSHPVSLINQKAQRSLGSLVYWRRDRDSNPGYGCPYNGFRIRPVRPLRHLSKSARIIAASGMRRKCFREVPRQGDERLPRRLRSRRRGLGGSGPCPFFCVFPYPRGGTRQG